MAAGGSTGTDAPSALPPGARPRATTRETELTAENALLAHQITTLRATLEKVAVAELEAEIDDLDLQEAELRDELAAARQAACEAADDADADAASSLVGRALASAVAAASEGASEATPPSPEAPSRQASSERREWEREISELEHALATLQLRRHIVQDSLHQLSVAEAALVDEGHSDDGEEGSGCSDDGRTSPSRASISEDEGYVPFVG